MESYRWRLRLRLVTDRVLILHPTPLTVHGRANCTDKFDVRFTRIDSHLVKWQLGESSWQEHGRCRASIDFAKHDEVLPDLLWAEWDLVVIDETHKRKASGFLGHAATPVLVGARGGRAQRDRELRGSHASGGGRAGINRGEMSNDCS